MKIDWEHICDKHVNPRDADGVSLFDSCVNLPEIFDTFKAKLKEGALKEEVEYSPKRSRRFVYYCTLIFQWVLSQIDVDVDIMEPVV